MHVSGSLGSTHAVGSDSSSSSDDDDLMDEDMEETYVTTPQVSRIRPMGSGVSGIPFGSPAMSSLASFQQRQRPRKQQKKKGRGPFGLGFSNSSAAISKSPPSTIARARRESISWQANQLHISGADTDEGEALGDGQRGVIRRVVTRRGNLLPKTKTFARIRAALMEEGAPAESESRREAEVVKQVWEGDNAHEPRIPPSAAMESTQTTATATTAPSSPTLTQQDSMEDVADEDMMVDLSIGLSSSFKQHAMKNSKGKTFWDTFSESSSIGGARTTPPPAAFLPRGSSSGVSEDVAMDSPSLGGLGNGQIPPTAAEITRRINSKRRRDDDFDPVSFKRRAVSPGMSAHNSPIMQSPLQRDVQPWGSVSRPSSNGGEKAPSSAPSETGNSTPGALSGASSTAAPSGRVNGKGRVGFQRMIDTNDGIMRMSIE